MTRLFLMLYTLASTVLMGCLIILVLALGYDTANPIIGAVLLGLVSAVPVAWMISAKLYAMK